MLAVFGLVSLGLASNPDIIGPKIQTENFSLEYGDEKTITLTADKGQLIYVKFISDDDIDGTLIDGYLFKEEEYLEMKAGRNASEEEYFPQTYEQRVLPHFSPKFLVLSENASG